MIRKTDSYNGNAERNEGQNLLKDMNDKLLALNIARDEEAIAKDAIIDFCIQNNMGSCFTLNLKKFRQLVQ